MCFITRHFGNGLAFGYSSETEDIDRELTAILKHYFGDNGEDYAGLKQEIRDLLLDHILPPEPEHEK
jgi:hypothetical protein